MVYQDSVVVDMVVHAFNHRWDNCKNEFAEEWISDTHARHQTLHPDGYQLSEEQFFRNHTAEELANVVFLESDIDFAVYQPVHLEEYYEDGLIPLEKGIEFTQQNPDRSMLYGHVNPRSPYALEELERQAEEHDIAGVKTHPVYFREDGRNLSNLLNDPDVGIPLVEKARDLGLEFVASHKALPFARTHHKYYTTDDIEEVAPMFPDMKFEVVHAGYAFLEETTSVLARFPNVYANLESTFVMMMDRPRKFAESLGEMLKWAGPEKLMFGSGATLYYPQLLIEKFWEFEFPEDMRKKYGYPKITDEMKRKILGRNACEYLGLDPDEIRQTAENDEWAEKRRELDGQPEPWSSL